MKMNDIRDEEVKQFVRNGYKSQVKEVIVNELHKIFGGGLPETVLKVIVEKIDNIYYKE
jgi:hypothetical protein